jgi:hypothetical protein
MNTRGFRGFRPPERNTLPPLCVSYIESVIESVCLRACSSVTMCAFPFIVLREAHTRMLSPNMRA